MTRTANSTGLPLRLAAWTIALGLVALPVVGVVNGWFASDRWPFRQLKVDAEFKRINAEQVRAAVSPGLEKGFFAVDLDAVRASLESLPWVEHVEVRKRWPDLLEVRLVERSAAALWGDLRLVSTTGELFEVPGESLPQGLPRLAGPDERVTDVLAFQRAANEAFDGTGLAVEAVQLSQRGSWSLDLSSGAHVAIGREAPRARLGRFIETLPRLDAEPGAAWSRADLRYANGFALLWVSRDLSPHGGGPANAAPRMAQPAPRSTEGCLPQFTPGEPCTAKGAGA